MTTAKRLTERISAPFSGSTVNREAGTIGNVLLCGFESANGRDYPAAVFKRDFAKYEGRPVNADHASAATVDRRLGWFSGVKVGEDQKPRGTLNLLKTHPLYERVMEAAERNPRLFGFSHVAYCKTRTEHGREIVEAIDHIESIDLVADPATTGGFFEGKRVKISLNTFVAERGPKWGAKTWAAATKVVEDMGDMSDVPVMDDMPPEATDGGDLKAGLMAALMPLLDDAFESGNSDKAVAALKDFIKLHAKHTGTAAADTTPTDTAAEEAKKKTVDVLGILKECRAECGPDFTPGEALLEALVAQPDAAKRKALLSEHKSYGKAGKERVTSGGGRNTPPARTEESKVPIDGKAFAEAHR